MSSIIVKNSDGKIWKNSDGKILKAKKFSQEVIQNGLAFWGRADANLLTLVDGLVSEAYDVRETNFSTPAYGKMIQSVVTNRLSFGVNYLNTYSSDPNILKNLEKSSQIAKSLFIVFSIGSAPSGAARTGLGISSGYTYIGNYQSSSQYLVNQINSSYYNNLLKLSSLHSIGYNTILTLSSNVNANLSSANILLGSVANSGGRNMNIYEWGWYTRALSEIEVIYNQQALMAKYGIT